MHTNRLSNYGRHKSSSVPLLDLDQNIDFVPLAFHKHAEEELEMLQAEQPQGHGLYYGVEDRPPWITAILFGLQQVMVCGGSAIALPIIVASQVCAANSGYVRLKLISATLIATGFSTILQTTVGVRLPLLQGPSYAFLPPVAVLMSLPKYACPASMSNVTDPSEIWGSRICLIQGGMISASFVQMLIGLTGTIGFITKFIGPLTIAPLMCLLGLSLVDAVFGYISKHWISIVLMFLLILFAVYLNSVKVPCLCPNRKRRFSIYWIPLFAMFPYMMAIMITWSLSAILTESGAYNNSTDLAGRTDVMQHIIVEAPWVSFPYPGQWGAPSVNTAIFIGMTAGTICSVIESVGDYHACARVTCNPPPPMHAVNRGIFMEGFCCCFAGLIGGFSVTTYSENIGVIGITKVASGITMQIAGVIMIIVGLFTKVGAVMATLPDPLVGAVLLVSMAMVMGVGLSSVQLIDLKLSRNMAILGLSILAGLLIPKFALHTNWTTGVKEVDQAITIFFGTEMIVGGMVGFFLDNTVPGATRAQRGLKVEATTSAIAAANNSIEDSNYDVYGFPPIIMKYLNKWKFSKYIPMLPTFQQQRIVPKGSATRNKESFF